RQLDRREPELPIPPTPKESQSVANTKPSIVCRNSVLRPHWARWGRLACGYRFPVVELPLDHRLISAIPTGLMQASRVALGEKDRI
ncbi:MAG TPA: hypothetical protein VHR66_27465, partial [Gemmataceae bacterium]|nr:hypothetical protein [Gemmataceae bacterium]